jgi:SNF2 family DNA or RNA helicase
MNHGKKYSEKINHLIEGLSGFDFLNPEEAEELLKAAGKDPAKVLKHAKERLHVIQTAAGRKNQVHQNNRRNKSVLTEFPVLRYNNEKHLIGLDKSGSLTNIVRADDAYAIFIKKKAGKWTASEEVKGTDFRKLTAALKFNINLSPAGAHVRPFLYGISLEFYLTISQVRTALETGYFMFWSETGTPPRHVWVPLDKESLKWGKEFLMQVKEGDTIPLGKALGYYAKQDQFSWLQFTEDRPDPEHIPDTTPLSAESSLFIRELYGYQEEGLNWLAYCCMNRLGSILGDDMGLGKTAQTIALIAWLFEKNILEKVLIVVPATLTENWRREFEFFAPSIVPYIHRGSDRTGSVQELDKHRVILTSYSMVINDRYLFNKIKWGLTLCDEASLLKNPDSERRIALSSIESEVRIVMTGTPVENSLTDLWSLADYVNPGYLGKREDFVKKYIHRDIEQTLAEGSLKLLRKYISYIMLRRKKEDVLDTLPERTDIHQALEMNDEERRLYNAQRESVLSKITGPSGVNVLEEILKLRQFTTHPFLTGSDEMLHTNISELGKNSIKFLRTIELLSEIKERNEKVLIFTEYLKMIDIFKQVLSSYYKTDVLTIDGRVETEERQKNIDVFSARKGFAIMVLNPRTAGMGLNITAANHVIHYTRQWNPALEEQASARAYRNGQKKNVNIYYLYYSGTIEEVIDKRLKAKMALSGEVIVPTSEVMTEEEKLEILYKHL